MDIPDEKFFEELVKEKTSAEAEFGREPSRGEEKKGEPFKIGLAKASAVSAQKISKPAAFISRDDEPEGQLAIDVYQTPNEIVIESAIAGVRPEDIDVTVTHDSVVIKGERRRSEEIKSDDYFYQECYWGRFSRSVILPQEIDPENADVKFKNGILTIVLPKINRKKQKKLKVKVE